MTGAKGRGMGPRAADEVSAQNDGGYRRDVHRNYRPQDHGNYGKYDNGDVQRKYEHGLKYDNGDKYDRSAPDQVSANNNGAYRNGNHSGDGGQASQALASLDKRISSVQQDLNSALQEVTTKENEKFDLIFSILVELQKRQAQLEESVRTVKAQLSSNPCMDQQSQLGNPQQQGQQQGQQRGQQASSSQQGQQVAGQMGTPMGGFMAGQVPMSQQYVAASDGSGGPAYFAPVVVAMPQSGAQMPYAVPQMMQAAGPMQAMPQQMAMQFVGQGDEYQWGAPSAATESTARGSGTQPAEGASQEAQPLPSAESSKIDPWVEEE